ncbi:MAG: toxic anion resistance protein [Ruminococcus bromii]|nr:toxic anion resistance protein [Ruminococcus bromii]
MAIDLILDGDNTAASNTAIVPTEETQKILDEVEQLSPEEKKQIEDFSKKIDIHKSEIVMNYGATIQKQSASIATKTLQDVKTKDTGEVAGLLVQMVGAMNGLSGGQDRKGIIANFMQKVKGKAITFRTQNESAEKTLQRIEKQLEGHKLVLQKDIAMLDDLYEENWQTFKALTLYIKAAEIALDDARNKQLPELYAKAQETGLPEDAMKADEFAKQCDQFDKQVHNLRLTRTNCLQSAPQIKMIQHSDMDMAMKLQSSIVNTMPLWRKQIAMAIVQQNNIKATEASNAVDDLTNRMLKEQAAQFHIAVVESAKASQRSIIDADTIDYVNNEITGAVLDYIAIEEQGRKDRQAAVQVIANSEKKLISDILSAKNQ